MDPPDWTGDAKIAGRVEEITDPERKASIFRGEAPSGPAMGHRRDRLRSARFIDSSFWIAFQRLHDRHHEAARALFAQTGYPLWTSNHVLGETWTTINRRSGHHDAVHFLETVERSARLRIVHVDQATEQKAWAWLRRRDEREYSFVGATSFFVMWDAGILDALAFDADFAAAGFVELRP